MSFFADFESQSSLQKRDESQDFRIMKLPDETDGRLQDFESNSSLQKELGVRM